MTTRSRVATMVVFGALGMLMGITTAAAGGGGHCESREGRGTRVELAKACFMPTTLFADAGETITFVNRDPFVHNVSGSGWGHYDDMEQGARFTTSFADEGVYAYACTLHPGMTGSIVVGEGDSGAAVAAVDDARPPTATAADPRSGDVGWIVAGAAGLVIGAAAGAGITIARSRATDSGIAAERGHATGV